MGIVGKMTGKAKRKSKMREKVKPAKELFSKRGATGALRKKAGKSRKPTTRLVPVGPEHPDYPGIRKMVRGTSVATGKAKRRVRSKSKRGRSYKK